MTGKKKKLTAESIDDAEVPAPKPDAKATDEKAFFNHEENMHKAKLGWVGAIWGSKSEKPGNVAAIVLLMLLVFVAILLLNHDKWGELLSDMIALMMSTITLILGYLFGSSNRD